SSKAGSASTPARSATDRHVGQGAAAEPAGAVPAELAPKLDRLGIRTWFDLVLHLPLRYEDETRLVPLASAPAGQAVQVEAVVVDAEIQYRGRRQLVVRVQEQGAALTLRFLHFYPSQLKQFAPGAR